VHRGLTPAAGLAGRGFALALALALVLAAGAAACGRSQGVPDEQLGDLVIDRKGQEPPIDVERAAKDPAELGRALRRSHGGVIAALGPHTVKLKQTNTVVEGGKQISFLEEQTLIELGEGGAFHALYTNSADYGSEVIFTGGVLYLRPRYQRWHERAADPPEEPAAIRDRYFSAFAATWDMLAPGAELIDRGAVEVAGRGGRKIEIRLMPSPATPEAEKLTQRKWREGRSVEELAGEIVLDADKGAPLAVKLAGAIGYMFEGQKRIMKLGIEGSLTRIGTAAAITAPPRTEVVATPERLREVEERDYLLHNIAPPLHPGADPLKPEPAKPEPAKPEPPKPDPAKPQPAKPDPAKPVQPKGAQ
jgi:hypothetical protein